MSINNMELFLDFTKPKLNFELTFVGIQQVLIEIWLCKHEFQNISFGQFRYQICQ